MNAKIFINMQTEAGKILSACRRRKKHRPSAAWGLRLIFIAPHLEYVHQLFELRHQLQPTRLQRHHAALELVTAPS